MTRTTRATLDQRVALINSVTGRAGSDAITIGYAYGRPRLYRADGSVEVNPRLPTGQLLTFLDGMVAALFLPNTKGSPDA